MSNWYLITVVGENQPGIVANVSHALASTGCHLAETSMLQMADNFTIMMLVSTRLDQAALQQSLNKAATELQLHVHIDAVGERQSSQTEPNMRISVHGADRSGIVADVTAILARNHFNIIDLESAPGGDEGHPFYIMTIEGTCSVDSSEIEQQLRVLATDGIEIHVDELDTLIG